MLVWCWLIVVDGEPTLNQPQPTSRDCQEYNHNPLPLTVFLYTGLALLERDVTKWLESLSSWFNERFEVIESSNNTESLQVDHEETFSVTNQTALPWQAGTVNHHTIAPQAPIKFRANKNRYLHGKHGNPIRPKFISEIFTHYKPLIYVAVPDFFSGWRCTEVGDRWIK